MSRAVGSTSRLHFTRARRLKLIRKRKSFALENNLFTEGGREGQRCERLYVCVPMACIQYFEQYTCRHANYLASGKDLLACNPALMTILYAVCSKDPRHFASTQLIVD